MRDLPNAGAIVAAYGGLVRGYFARRCASSEDAEDLAQEVFCAVLSARDRFRGESSLSTWIYAICRNVYSGWADRRARERRLLSSMRAEAAAAADLPDSAMREPDCLDDVLRSLRAAERNLYTAFYRQGLRIREIARAAGLPEGTVKYRLYALRKRLRLLLSASGRSTRVER